MSPSSTHKLEQAPRTRRPRKSHLAVVRRRAQHAKTSAGYLRGTSDRGVIDITYQIRGPACWAFAGLVLLTGASLAAQSHDAIRDTILENGLVVIVTPNHTTPVATLEVVIRAGAFTQVEPPDEGLPHVLEHMLFKTYRGGRGFGPDASDIGALYNATTGDERVTYFLTLPSDAVEQGLELLGDLVRDPDFDRQALEEELLVVRGELLRLASDPYRILNHVSNMALWGSAFQRKNIIGNLNTILTAEPDRLRDHYRRYYVPNNAALIVSGDVDADEIFEWAQDRFRRWDEGPDPFAGFASPMIEPLERDTAFVLQMGASDVTFQIKWHGPRVSEDPTGTLAADVFSAIFGQATSGTQRRLVDTGMFQSVTMRYQTLEHVGAITLSARTTPEMLGRALTELGVELALLGDPDYFEEDDLTAAKRHIRVGDAIARESVPSAAHSLASFWAVGGLDYYRAYGQGLQDVTSEDVRAYVDRYIFGQPKVIAILATEELAQQLGPVIGGIVDRWPRVP